MDRGIRRCRDQERGQKVGRLPPAPAPLAPLPLSTTVQGAGGRGGEEGRLLRWVSL